MLTAEEICRGKERTVYGTPNDIRHEHDDCIRMAYEWLDAQIKTKGKISKTRPLKHIIEKWAGRYVSTSDVEVAAALHPEIHGTYPYFNISSKFTEPAQSRLAGLGEAHTHKMSQYSDRVYARKEQNNG